MASGEMTSGDPTIRGLAPKDLVGFDKAPGEAETVGRTIGNVMVNLVPYSGAERTVIPPPCASTIARTIASPSPVPLFLVVTNGSKIRSCIPAGIPGPLSEQRSSIELCCGQTLRVRQTVVSLAACHALSRRFWIALASASRFPSTRAALMPQVAVTLRRSFSGATCRWTSCSTTSNTSSLSAVKSPCRAYPSMSSTKPSRARNRSRILSREGPTGMADTYNRAPASGVRIWWASAATVRPMQVRRSSRDAWS